MSITFKNPTLKPRPGKLVIKHPLSGEPTDVILEVQYASPLRVRNKIKELAERDLEEDEQMIEMLASLIIGWEGIEQEWSPENALALLADPDCDFILTQLDEFTLEKHNFFIDNKKKR